MLVETPRVGRGTSEVGECCGVAAAKSARKRAATLAHAVWGILRELFATRTKFCYKVAVARFQLEGVHDTPVHKDVRH